MVRKLVVPIAILFGFAILGWFFYRPIPEARSAPVADDIQFTDAVERAIELRTSQSNALSQIAILALSGLIAVVLKRFEERKLSGAAGAVSIAAGAFLILSLWLGDSYVDELVGALVTGGATSQPEQPSMIPDVFTDEYDTTRVAQFRFLVGGAVVAALSLFRSPNAG